MNKYVRITLMGILSLGLLSTSCKKKKDEPVPPTPPVGPVTPSSEEIKPSTIVLKLKDDATEFTIDKVVGTDLKITGANETALAKGKITAAAGATIQIAGKLDTLALSSASFASTDFSAATGLRYLRMIDYTGTETNIAEATELTYLYIDISTNSINVGKIDASKLSKLKTLIINAKANSYGNNTEVLSLPLSSELTQLNLFMVGTTRIENIEAQTKLSRLIMYGRAYSTPIFDLTANTELVEIVMGRIGGVSPALNLGDKPKLRSIYNLSNAGGVMNYPEVIITSAPLLKDYNGKDAFTYRSWRNASGLEGISGRMSTSGKFVLNGTEITKVPKSTAQSFKEWAGGSSTIVDLKDNKIATADFSGYTKVKEIHLQGNKLTAQAITDLIATLPTHAAGTAKIYLNKASGETNAAVTAEQTQALAAKGWVVTAP